MSSIMDVALKFMTFDPNYCYDDDEDEQSGGEEEGEDDDYSDDEDYDADDDDTSWKVRKAAIRVLRAIVQVRSEVFQPEVYASLLGELLGRVKEREETVRLEVLGCLSVLLDITLQKCNTSTSADKRGQVAATLFPPVPKLVAQRSGSAEHSISGTVQQVSAQDVPEEVLELVKSKVPLLVRIIKKQLGGQSIKTKNAVFVLLDVLVRLLKVCCVSCC
jgi:hypothetical protein